MPAVDVTRLEVAHFGDSMGKPLHIAPVGENRAFRRMFSKNRMTIGVFFPIEAFEGDVPAMSGQERLAQQAEKLGFAALWTRDVPLRDPTFGDVGQIYDAWVWLGWIAAQTSMIGLATGSIVLPLRHPIHTAKAAASVDQLSNGRFVMGVASGDRPVEFPAFGVNWNKRDALFRENLQVLRKLLNEEFPRIESDYGTMLGTADMVPKPTSRLPLLITGSSRQSLEWIAANADGWITYPRSPELQKEHVARWHATVAALAPGTFKPFAQSLYVDLAEDPNAPPRPIHLGFSGGRKIVLRFLDALQVAGVNHVALNLKYGKRSAGEALDEIGREIIPVLEMSRGPAAQLT